MKHVNILRKPKGIKTLDGSATGSSNDAPPVHVGAVRPVPNVDTAADSETVDGSNINNPQNAQQGNVVNKDKNNPTIIKLTCRKIIEKLVQLANQQKPPVKQQMIHAIQDLVVGIITKTEFQSRLKSIIGFLPDEIFFIFQNLNLMREMLIHNEFGIEGICAPIKKHYPTQIGPPYSQPQFEKPSSSRGIKPHTFWRQPVPPTLNVNPLGRMMQPVMGAPMTINDKQQRFKAPNAQPNVQYRIPMPKCVCSTPKAQYSTINFIPVRPNVVTVKNVNMQDKMMGSTMRPTATITSASCPGTLLGTFNMGPSKGPTSTITAPPTVTPRMSKNLKTDLPDMHKDHDAQDVDELVDSAVLGGINLDEEYLSGTEHIGGEEHSTKEEPFLNLSVVMERYRKIFRNKNMVDPTPDSINMISQAAHDYIKNIIKELSIRVEMCSYDLSKDPNYEKVSDVRAQLKFIADVERVQENRRKQREREELLQVANARSKNDNPQQAKMRAKAKEMLCEENAKLRLQATNTTALEASGPRKKYVLLKDVRPPMKRATMRDMISFMENDRHFKKSLMLYECYLKQ